MTSKQLIDDLTWLAGDNLKNEIDASFAESKRKLARNIKQSHWRLNELEHQSLGLKFPGWQTFTYPYGARHNATSGQTLEQHFASLPPEHCGDPSKMVDTLFGGDYSITEWLYAEELRQAWHKRHLKYMFNWRRVFLWGKKDIF